MVIKKCKKCLKNERFTNRTICLPCINKEATLKMREQARKNKEKVKVKKQKSRVKKAMSISSLKKKADDIFSIFIRRRDQGKCITCGTVKEWKHMQAGHYIPRDCLELRYSEVNCHCQCPGCNIFRKGNYTIYSIRLMELYGPNILYELDEIVKKYKEDGLKQYKQDFYLSIIDKYKI